MNYSAQYHVFPATFHVMYIAESRLPMGQCTTRANATEYVRLFILRVYNIYVVCIGFYAEL